MASVKSADKIEEGGIRFGRTGILWNVCLTA